MTREEIIENYGEENLKYFVIAEAKLSGEKQNRERQAKDEEFCDMKMEEFKKHVHSQFYYTFKQVETLIKNTYDSLQFPEFREYTKLAHDLIVSELNHCFYPEEE